MMLGTYLKDSLNFYRKHWVAMALIILPFVVPLEFIDLLLSQEPVDPQKPDPQRFLFMGIFILCDTFLSAAIICYIGAAVTGQGIGSGVAWRYGLQKLFPLLGLYLLMSLAITIGLMVFILPGLIIAVRMMFAGFALVLEGQPATAAMKRSWQISEAYFWPILGGVLLISAVLLGPLVILSSIAGEGQLADLLVYVIDVTYGVLTTFYTVFLYRIYDAARSDKAALPGDD